MIVPADFEQTYDRMHPLLASVESRAQPLLRGVSNAVGGRYAGSRIKPTESLYMKIEKEGEFTSLFAFDDLVAATIVIPNKSILPKVEELLAAVFDQATAIPTKTSRPEAFIYDDRHVLVKLKQDPLNPDLKETQVNIEIQIKTEMQAASSAVTRELSYKPAVLSWAKARLAGQLRALVEVADSLLATIEEETQTAVEEPDSSYFAAKNELLRELGASFPANELPADRRRFAGIVEAMQKDCRPSIKAVDLGTLLRDNRHATIRDAQSLSVVQKVFLMLLADGRLGNLNDEPFRLWGKRSYIVTEFMEAICPAAKLVPQNRRLSIATEAEAPLQAAAAEPGTEPN